MEAKDRALGSVLAVGRQDRKGGEEEGRPEFSGLDFELSYSWQEIR